ncbi:beta-amyrin 28-monooxygenase-like isoform X2 [Cicer arietinum]|uniref:Cytochrome P450 716A2-like isoform X2 n=1 Tax=Cicer arietinum TaxID=3827 RepID=A0A3Q7YBU3_CICAR|nr:cytochrome P450 716A2-like isoform X2 [Cicer arietinum]
MVVEISFIFLCVLTLTLSFLLSKFLSKSQTKNVPKGSLGYPIIGETLGFLKAQRKDKGSEWIEERVSKYGPVFKTSLLGSPTVVIIGQEGNKFVLGSSEDVLSAKKPLTLQKILGKQSLIELTGSSNDTSATLMSLMIWKLSRDQEVYNKVLEEQMEILKQREGNEERLTWGEIQKMKYTWRVAQELMRMIPPLFGGFRKALKDTSYQGYHIPKGWQVYWPSCGTHMDKEIFENPQKFDPSRFENPSKPIPSYSYLPFGAGIHYCIGNEFARVETLTTIHNFVKMYEWSQLNPEETITRQPMPYPSLGLPIKIKPRCNIS